MDRSGHSLFGRERELGELRAALRGAALGRGVLALLVGEPGIGKTRLAAAFTDEVAAGGGRATWGRAWEAGGAPAYWPWIEALRPNAFGCSTLSSLFSPTWRGSVRSLSYSTICTPQIRVLGRAVDLDLAASLAGIALGEARDLAGEAALADVLVDTRDRTAFSHILIREVLYQQLPAVRRAELHARVGRALAERDGADEGASLAEAVHHRFAAVPSAPARAGSRAPDRACARGARDSLSRRGPALGAQAGEGRLRRIVTEAGFSHFRRASQTPFNLVLEARA